MTPIGLGRTAVIGLMVACGCGRPSTAPATRLAAADLAAIHAIDTAFVGAWLRDDTSAVLKLFHPAAVLFPPGSAPVAGVTAIKAYWWPEDGSRTKITAFSRATAEVDGSGPFAYWRGTATLGWVYQKDGKSSAQTSRSTDLVLLARDGAGQWQIIRQMWNPLPP